MGESTGDVSNCSSAFDRSPGERKLRQVSHGTPLRRYWIFSQLHLPFEQPALYPWLNSTGHPLPPPHDT